MIFEHLLHCARFMHFWQNAALLLLVAFMALETVLASPPKWLLGIITALNEE